MKPVRSSAASEGYKRKHGDGSATAFHDVHPSQNRRRPPAQRTRTPVPHNDRANRNGSRTHTSRASPRGAAPGRRHSHSLPLETSLPLTPPQPSVRPRGTQPPPTTPPTVRTHPPPPIPPCLFYTTDAARDHPRWCTRRSACHQHNINTKYM